MKTFDNIVLHIPHASAYIPDKETWKGDIDKAIYKWTDWHTDILFCSSHNPKVHAFIFPFSRFYCDIERLYNDPMESQGTGIAYRHIEDCRRELTDEQIHRIFNIYDSARKTFDEMAVYPETLIIDCHSFPSLLAPDVDICIGYNEDSTKPDDDILEMVSEHFRKAGYRTTFNIPYSNSICANGCTTMMLEINKSIYLQPDGQAPGTDIHKVNVLINELYTKLTSYKHQKFNID